MTRSDRATLQLFFGCATGIPGIHLLLVWSCGGMTSIDSPCGARLRDCPKVNDIGFWQALYRCTNAWRRYRTFPVTKCPLLLLPPPCYWLKAEVLWQMFVPNDAHVSSLIGRVGEYEWKLLRSVPLTKWIPFYLPLAKIWWLWIIRLLGAVLARLSRLSTRRCPNDLPMLFSSRWWETQLLRAVSWWKEKGFVLFQLFISGKIAKECMNSLEQRRQRLKRQLPNTAKASAMTCLPPLNYYVANLVKNERNTSALVTIPSFFSLYFKADISWPPSTVYLLYFLLQYLTYGVHVCFAPDAIVSGQLQGWKVCIINFINRNKKNIDKSVWCWRAQRHLAQPCKWRILGLIHKTFETFASNDILCLICLCVSPSQESKTWR